MSQMSSTPLVPTQCPPMRQPSQPSQYQFQTHPSAVTASATAPFQQTGASMIGQPQSQPSSMQPPFHSGSSVTTTPHQLSSSTPFNPPASWGDQSSISSVSSSGGSVASMFTGISNKLDGILPSGQSTPTALTGHHDSRPHDSAFPSRQSTLQSDTNISGSSVFGVSATTAWNATSSSGFDDAFAMMRNAEPERPQQKALFGSNDPFDRLASERAATSTFDSLSDSRGPPISSAQSQDAPAPDKPFVPPRQTSLRRGSGAEDTDDTMKNLRKTFAGIFGDM
ncbi:hypothetical protein CRM22_001427 [Opisthorchis felineus]|uniref:Synapsin ATP-binding domain-containing protein n=1 Tax=Opisthorchis felineus TaxID=147828 RepID=A0A4S2MAP5_OPIFE|nr:hypothetical protein CRM22_001427 [Opisthorchis felineus]